MSNHNQDVNFSTFLIGSAAALVLLFVAVFLLIQLVSFIAPERELSEEDMQRQKQAMEERIESPAQVSAGEAEDAGDEPELRAASDIYENTCAACHDTGSAGAPVLGETGEWEERVEQDFDTLVEHVIDGLGAMPPRGGDDSLSDDEIRWTVAYMMDDMDFDLDGVASALEDEEEALAGDGDSAEEEVAEDGDEAAEDGDEAADADEEADDGAEAEDVAMDDLDPEAGQQTYDNACASCHDTGAANAPEINDKAAWEPRLEKGLATLIEHAIEGFQGDAGFMPPRGGQSDLSDEEVENAVGYIVQQVEE